MTVYVANFKSTNQVWMSTVYSNIEVVNCKMSELKLERVFASDALTFLEYQDMADKTQTVCISEMMVVE